MKIDARHLELNPTQKLALEDNTTPLLRMSGGFGSGKTVTGALKAVTLSALNPGVPGAIWARSWGSMKATCLRTLKEVLPPALMRIHDPQVERYLMWNNAPVFLCSADRPELRDGISVGWYWSDEGRHYKPEALRIMTTRKRIKCRSSQGFFTTTPGGSLLDYFGGDNPLARTIRASTRENARNMDPNYVEGIMLSHSPRMRRAFLDGEDIINEGAVFSQLPGDIWDSEWVFDYRPQPHRRTILALDPGYRRSAWFLAQEVGPTQWVAFHEWIGEDSTDWDMVQRVNATCEKNGWKIDSIWVDPAGDGTQTAIGLDTIAMLRGIKTRPHNHRDGREPRHIHYIRHPYTAIEYGIDKLRVLLGDPAEDQPIMLRFHSGLKDIERDHDFGLVKSLTSWAYEEPRPGRPYSNTPPDNIHKHFCLSGDTLVCTESGWTRIDSIPESGIVLGPGGFTPYESAGETGKSVLLYRLRMSDGTTIDATADHRFCAATTGPGGRVEDDSDFQWTPVSRLRSILHNNGGRPGSEEEGIPAQARVGVSPRPHPEGLRGPPQGSRQGEQHNRESGVPAPGGASTEAHAGSGAAEGVLPRDKESAESRRGVAQEQGGARVPQVAREGVVEGSGGEGAGVRCVWLRVSDQTQGRGEVLPPELQGDGPPSQTRDQAKRVESITELGVADSVYCMHVPDGNAFVLANGVISHNCDAARYLAVGLWLTSDLRERDPRMGKAAGFESK